MKWVCLHGFWGEPSDFKFLESHFSILAPRLNNPLPFDEWSREWAQRLENEKRPLGLLGYSMGGRLALHLLILAPHLFSQAVLLSTHHGQLSSEERESRIKWRKEWQHKMDTLDFHELVEAWNDQAVFRSDRKIEKTPWSRTELTSTFETWALEKHTFDWVKLQRLKLDPIWMFGALDQRFLTVKDDLERHNVPGVYKVVPGAGHRLLDFETEVVKAMKGET